MISTKATLSFFPTRDADGRALQKAFAPMARELGFIIKECQEATLQDYTRACWNDDVVVLDATVTHPGKHNYELAIPIAMDHVLVASRKYLPINFYGLRDAIIDKQTGNLIYGTPVYPNSLSNEDILRWLFLQLQDLRHPRPDREKGVLGGVFKYVHKLIKSDRRPAQSGQVFISYRIRDWPEVRKLKKCIEDGKFHNGQSKAVRCFPPNALTDEVMTEQRRWQMLSLIDRFIGPVDEFWAYESRSYYDSWWTLGQLATLAYRGCNGDFSNRLPQLRIFNPDKGEAHYPGDDYLPEMTREQQIRMARWLANCDTTEIGAESIVMIRLLGELPLINRLSYFQDRVWKQEFWQHPVLDCKRCRRIGKQRNHFDIESFLWTRDPGFFRFSTQEIKRCVIEGQITCPHCNTRYGFAHGPPHYLWMPAIKGNRSGDFWKYILDIDWQDPDEVSLIQLPTYRML